MIKLPIIDWLKNSAPKVGIFGIEFRTIYTSEYMRTNCCDVFVELIEDFRADGQWVWCPCCGHFKAFVSGEDMDLLARDGQPQDEKEWWSVDTTEIFEDFAEAVRNAGNYMQQLLNGLWENPQYQEEIHKIEDELIIGEGTQMVDGQWKPKGFLGWLDKKEDPQSED